MSDTTRAGTLRKPTTPAEYMSRDNEYVHRWFLRQALTSVAGEYRGLFEKEEQERAKALAALHDDLVRAHERIADQERALEAYRAGTWESRLQLRWARAKLAVRALFRIAAEPEAEVKRMLDDYREAERLAGFDLEGNRIPRTRPAPIIAVTRPVEPAPSCTDPRD